MKDNDSEEDPFAVDDFLQKKAQKKQEGKKEILSPAPGSIIPDGAFAKIRPIFESTQPFETTSVLISKEHSQKLQLLSMYATYQLSAATTMKGILYHIIEDYFRNNSEELRALEEQFLKTTRKF